MKKYFGYLLIGLGLLFVGLGVVSLRKEPEAVSVLEPAPAVTTVSNSKPAKTPKPAPTVVRGHGPYWLNEKDSLEIGKSYKFHDDLKVYVYLEDGKLHEFVSPEAFARYHRCPVDMTPLECRGIYKMPSTISKNDSRLNGYKIR